MKEKRKMHQCIFFFVTDRECSDEITYSIKTAPAMHYSIRIPALCSCPCLAVKDWKSELSLLSFLDWLDKVRGKAKSEYELIFDLKMDTKADHHHLTSFSYRCCSMFQNCHMIKSS